MPPLAFKSAGSVDYPTVNFSQLRKVAAELLRPYGAASHFDCWNPVMSAGFSGLRSETRKRRFSEQT